MSKSLKFMGGLAVAGLVAAGSAAFTSSGLTNNAGASKFIGGTVNQTITGATLTTVAYTFSDSTNTVITGATLTFDAAAEGKAVTLALSGGSGTQMTCGAVAATTFESACTGASYTGATSAAITVT